MKLHNEVVKAEIAAGVAEKVVSGLLADLNSPIGHVADTCEIPRCRQPAVLRYCTKSLCQRHWDDLCEDEANEERKNG